MNVLPLIHRELLVNSRKRATYWLRVVVTASALAVTAIYWIAFERLSGAVGMSPGRWLFQVLIWLSFATAGLFGVFFAADAISEERREGTLGLLFLTPLKGLDVVLGKLAGSCLRSGFALVAALPVLALPLLLGGITFQAYFRVALALTGTLILSSAMGLMVSAHCRESTRAIVVTLGFMLALAGVPVWIDLATFQVTATFVAFFSYASPGYALSVAANERSPGLWTALGFQFAFAWLALLLAARRAARFTEPSQQAQRSKATRWLPGSPTEKSQRRLRDRAPVAWLVQRRIRAPLVVALIVLLVFGGVMVHELTQTSGPGMVVFGGGHFFPALFYLVLLVWLAVLATRRTGDGRRDGELELLLATPLTIEDLVQGHWRGLARLFLGPAVILSVMMAAVPLVQISGTMESLVQANAGSPADAWPVLTQMVVRAMFGVIGIFTTLAAVAWVGLWLGLTGEKNATSAARTFLLVVVVPSVLLQFVQILFSLTGFFNFQSGWIVWTVFSITQGLLALAADIALLLWARRRLLTRFREAANGTHERRQRAIGQRVAAPETLTGS